AHKPSVRNYDMFPTRRQCSRRLPMRAAENRLKRLARVIFRPFLENLEDRTLPSLYSAAVLGDNPAAYWRLGESAGPTPLHPSRNGRNATYNGIVLYGVAGAIVGDPNTAVQFDGSTGYALAPGVPMTADITAEVWAKSVPATWNDYGFLLSDRSNNG